MQCSFLVVAVEKLYRRQMKLSKLCENCKERYFKWVCLLPVYKLLYLPFRKKVYLVVLVKICNKLCPRLSTILK